MTGLLPMLGKELVEQVRTRRLPIVTAVFVALGIGSVVLTYYLPDLVHQFGTQGIVIQVPPPTAADAVTQFQMNVGQAGVLAAILLAMGSVATERERGIAALLLSKPLGRAAYLTAKLLALAVTLLVGMLAAGVAAYIYTQILFAPVSAGGYAAMTGLLLVTPLLFGAITFLGSVLTSSSLAAAAVGIAALIGTGFLSLLPGVAEYLPASLDAAGKAVALGEPAGAWLPSLAVSALGAALAIGSAVFAFRRVEL